MNCPYREDSFYYWNLLKKLHFIALAIGGKVHTIIKYKDHRIKVIE